MSYVLFPSTIKPTGPFPSHEDTFGKGGFVALTGQSESLVDYETISNFLNEQIPTLRRKVGMLAYISSINQYYTCSSITGESGISGDWSRQYFSGRYFHGPSAPELNDLQVGERWFDTVAGTEYTYIPIEEGSTYNAWVDIDHLGGGGSGTLKYFYGENAPSGATVGDKWFNTNLGAELTYLPNVPDQAGGTPDNFWVMVNSLAQGVSSGIYVLKTGDTMSGSLTASRAFRSSNEVTFENDEFITKAYGDATYLEGNLSDYVKKTGDIMEGTLTGTSSSFTSLTASNGFIGTLTGTEASFNAFAEVSNSGSYENQPLLSVQKIGGNNVNDDGFYPGTTGFMNLPRLVLNNFSDNLWGWPKAIDFMTRPTSGAENSVIGWRIGDTYTSGGNSWLTFWGAPSQTFGNIGISAGPSGAGLTALGRFQYGVNREDTNGFYALKSFRMSDSPEFRDNEFVTKEISLTRPLPQTNSAPITFNRDWTANINESDFLFCSLTERKMGFKFPVDISVRWASSLYTNGEYSSSWRIANFSGVYPRNSTTISISVDRDRQQPLSPDPSMPPAGFSGDNVNTNIINIAGYLEGNPGKNVSCFLDVRPSATGPAGP